VRRIGQRRIRGIEERCDWMGIGIEYWERTEGEGWKKNGG
jgi:hypothetical protein